MFSSSVPVFLSDGFLQLEQELLLSIPVWEQETGRSFLVHGEPFLRNLMESVSAADQENKRKPARAGSVPPGATTPVNSTQGYVPGTKSTGVITPAVRTSSQVGGVGSQSVPNKRQKLGENGTTFQPAPRIPLGGHQGVNIVSANARGPSPTKLPTKGPTFMMSSSSLPRPAAIGMIMPKAGTQHHALGHGRVPTSVIYGAGVSGVPSGGYLPSASIRSASSVAMVESYGRIPSSNAGFAKKSSRALRESFKPRPSVESTLDLGMSVAMGGTGKRHWGGLTVQEEDEF